jgi:hypothetical protein
VSDPNEIVGHKSFDTGEICHETGFPKMRHEPLTRAEADAIWKACEEAKADREKRMPDEAAALAAMQDAYTRLNELGWRDATYCPKDGTFFQAIEAGSTGIHHCNYTGEWPNAHWCVYDQDTWPSRPILFKLYPEDQAKEDARWAEARKRLAEIKRDTSTQSQSTGSVR